MDEAVGRLTFEAAFRAGQIDMQRRALVAMCALPSNKAVPTNFLHVVAELPIIDIDACNAAYSPPAALRASERQEAGDE